MNKLVYWGYLEERRGLKSSYNREILHNSMEDNSPKAVTESPTTGKLALPMCPSTIPTQTAAGQEGAVAEVSGEVLLTPSPLYKSVNSHFPLPQTFLALYCFFLFQAPFIRLLTALCPLPQTFLALYCFCLFHDHGFKVLTFCQLPC